MIRAEYCYLIFICLILSNLSFGQDTINSETNELVDTVVIYKDPVILKKTVYAKAEKQKKESEMWVELSAAPFYTINHYSACPGYESYVNELKKSTSPSLGYNFGANFLFFYNKFLLSTGIGYTSFREKFTYQSSAKEYNLTNTYQYANIPLILGYRLINKGSFQTLFSSGIITQKMLSVKGKTHLEEDASIIQDIEAVRRYYSYNWDLVIKCKFIYLVSTTIYLGIEPYYFADIESVTRSLEPFTQRRNNLGINTNLIFALK